MLLLSTDLILALKAFTLAVDGYTYNPPRSLRLLKESLCSVIIDGL